MEFIGAIGNKEYYLDQDHEGGAQQVWTPQGWQKLPGKLLYRVPAIREAVRAQPGYKLLIADYSQIEVKLMAFLSQDPWLMAAINSGKDMHCYMGADCSGGLYTYDLLFAAKTDKLAGYLEEHPEAKSLLFVGRAPTALIQASDLAVAMFELVAARANIKTVTFGIPYGAGPETVGMMIRKRDRITGKYVETLEEATTRAEQLMDAYFQKAYVLKQFLEETKREGIRFGMARSPKGRIRWMTLPDRSDADYKKRIGKIGRWSGNHTCQAGCVDLLKPAGSRCYRALRGGNVTGPVIYPGARMLLSAHDELIVTSPDRYVEEVSECLREAMTWAYNNIRLDIRGKMHCLSELKNKVKVLTADYWVKD